MSSLAPGLLIAAPPLEDPNFDRSVVLLAEHNERGAFGWVINGRQLMTITELVEHAELEDVQCVAKGVVRLGGPVGQEQAWLVYPSAARLPELVESPEQFSLGGEIMVSPSQNVLRAVANGAGPKELFAVLGYAGWGPQQLESEIRAGAWLPTALQPSLVFEEDPSKMWAHAYAGIGATPMAFTSRTVGLA